ncbi:hypothetical protein TNCT_551211 [Trichonephila clavata]|uniref:Uncharacterized protein n=1 Tax=Trichonephila clavata TaxID=2740835 RepID=A0A8X6JZH1_TRICU|nr:hypothetical protein TNCT_551211 [Trichonephila clavata]
MDNSQVKQKELDKTIMNNEKILNEIKHLKGIVALQKQNIQEFVLTINNLQNKVNFLETKLSEEEHSKTTTKFYLYIGCSIHIFRWSVAFLKIFLVRQRRQM